MIWREMKYILFEEGISMKSFGSIACAMILGGIGVGAAPVELSFRGRVDYSNTSVISFEASGRLAYVAPVGRVVQSSIYSQDGKVIRPGGLLARQDTEIPFSNVKLAEARLEETIAVLAEKQANFERDRNLLAKKAVSLKDYLATEVAFETARIAKHRAELDLELAREVLAGCSIYAPFDGVVEEVYQRNGASVDVAHRVLKLSALNPIKIVVNLPENLTRQLDLTDGVDIYPVGASKPVLGWFDNRTISAKQVECYAENPLEPIGVLTAEEAKLPKVDDLSFVYFDGRKSEPTPWWVPKQALQTAPDGSKFVWKLEYPAPKLPVKRELTLKKIPVVPLDLEIQVGGYWLLGIKVCEHLKRGDLLAGSVPADCKDGDKVVYQTKRPRFRPGENVLIKIRGNFESPTEIPDKTETDND